LGILAISILFRSVYHIAARSFYAQQNTKTPLFISLVSIGLNIILVLWFTLGLEWGTFGLALAATLASAIQVIILFFIMGRHIDGLFNASFSHAIARMIVSTVVMSVVCYTGFSMFPLRATDVSFLSSFPKFVLVTLVSMLAYLFVSWLLKLSETKPIINMTKKILFGGYTK